MLGSDLVPDYLTRVEFGAFYGWPWNYWGGYEDKRVEPGRPDLREYTHRPDYGLGAHTAALGLTFAEGATLGEPFTNGAFIGLQVDHVRAVDQRVADQQRHLRRGLAFARVAVQHDLAVAPDLLLVGRAVIDVVDLAQGVQARDEFLLEGGRLGGEPVRGHV